MSISATRIRPVAPTGPDGQPLPLCRACWRHMRPPRSTVEQYPNTVHRTNAVMCSVCHKAGRRPDPELTDPDATARALERYLAGRFERKLKAALYDLTITRNMYALTT